MHVACLISSLPVALGPSVCVRRHISTHISTHLVTLVARHSEQALPAPLRIGHSPPCAGDHGRRSAVEFVDENVPIRCCSFKTRLTRPPKKNRPPRRARKAPPHPPCVDGSALGDSFIHGAFPPGPVLSPLPPPLPVASGFLLHPPLALVLLFAGHSGPRRSFCEPFPCTPIHPPVLIPSVGCRHKPLTKTSRDSAE